MFEGKLLLVYPSICINSEAHNGRTKKCENSPDQGWDGVGVKLELTSTGNEEMKLELVFTGIPVVAQS